MPKIYVDVNKGYLELHAMRAPVGHYREGITPEEYDLQVQDAIQEFARDYRVDIFQLGRSGRHICIEDTPENRRRYDMLSRAAIDAAKELWASMREVTA